MTDELRLVLVFVACILSAYSIGLSHGIASANRVCKRMMDELIETVKGREGR